MFSPHFGQFCGLSPEVWWLKRRSCTPSYIHTPLCKTPDPWTIWHSVTLQWQTSMYGPRRPIVVVVVCSCQVGGHWSIRILFPMQMSENLKSAARPRLQHPWVSTLNVWRLCRTAACILRFWWTSLKSLLAHFSSFRCIGVKGDGKNEHIFFCSHSAITHYFEKPHKTTLKFMVVTWWNENKFKESENFCKVLHIIQILLWNCNIISQKIKTLDAVTGRNVSQKTSHLTSIREFN